MNATTSAFGQGKWPFIDWQGIDPGYGTAWDGDTTAPGDNQPVGLEIQVHRPRVEPHWVLRPEHPWENQGISSYASFVAHEGRFHCWYECNGKADEAGLKVNVAYAVSENGVTWHKPTLRVRDYMGELANNLTELRGHGACVFVDPSAPTSEQFKTACLQVRRPAASQANHERPQCRTKWWRQVGGAVSPDGIHWQHLAAPILPEHFCDTQTVVEFEPHKQSYVLFTRQRNGLMKRRGIARSESADFYHFPSSDAAFESCPTDPPDWDFHAPGYHAWPGTPHASVMLQTIFHRASDAMSVHLATSRNGVVWHRPSGQRHWLGVEHIGGKERFHWLHSCHGILKTAPGEWSIYFRPHRIGHNAGKRHRHATGLMRAVCREDGFVSLSASRDGEFWTVPFVLASDTIALNLKCGFAGSVRVAVERVLGDYDNVGTVDSEPIPGFSLAEADVINGDDVNATLRWTGGSLSTLRGQTVRLRVQMYRAHLFALKF